MIYGVGTDLVKTERVNKACERDRFRQRIYTERERQMILSDLKKAADNFAAKEAVVKAFGTGFHMIAPSEIEILRDELGKPYAVFYGAAKELVEKKNLVFHVSITNTEEYASAVAVCEVIT